LKHLPTRAPARLLSRRTMLGALPIMLGAAPQAWSQERTAMEKIKASGILKVALYKDNAPYSDGGASGMAGLDVGLAQALAKQMQLNASLLPFDSGENMNDDLRNMVWRGHYLGYGPADVMLHVPVDKYFMEENRQAFIFAPYAREHLVVLHNPQALPQVYNPEDLAEQKIAVEQGSGAASALMGYKGGLLRAHTSLYKTGVDAAKAVLAHQSDVAFVTLAQAEAAVFELKLNKQDWAFSKLVLPGIPPNGWPLGMAVKAGNKELAKALDDALGALRQQGELLALFQSRGLTLAAP
jgi:ABC-type amino acid transport substrate-binding protein